ncbi:MAG: hypothetical protein ACR2MN_07130 [Acidimicrobiales bacterium]
MTVLATFITNQPRTLADRVAEPSVMILLPTTPGRHLTDADRRYLGRLSEIAIKRLRADLDPTTLATIQARLNTALGAAGAAGTDEGLGVLVSPQCCESILLPLAPRPRVIIDPTVATREPQRAPAAAETDPVPFRSHSNCAGLGPVSP